MSQGDQNSDCFLFDLEPHVAHIPLEGCRRKPSYDDLLAQLLAPNVDPLDEPIPPQAQPQPLETVASEKKERRRREKGKTLGVGQQRGHWQAEENRRYHWFLELHSGHFLNKHMRRMDKIFKCMERFVATREAEQCRSHHQKMEKKHGTFTSILRQLRHQHYHTADAELIVADMQAHGVECKEELLSWACLENEGEPVEAEAEAESEKSTVEATVEVSPTAFVDPLAELSWHAADLDLLML